LSKDDGIVVVQAKEDDMSMFDHVVVLDETLHCPHGHPVDGFQTKSLDAAMDTYLLTGPQVYRVERGSFSDDDAAAERWTVDGQQAVFQRRQAIEALAPLPHEILFYTTCRTCEPVLIRGDAARIWGDLVAERQLWVEFRATFETDGRRHIERTSGTRDDLVSELREDGLRVMRGDDPLAVAHREIRAARNASSPRRRRVRW
jgi:hypothetical protein